VRQRPSPRHARHLRLVEPALEGVDHHAPESDLSPEQQALVEEGLVLLIEVRALLEVMVEVERGHLPEHAVQEVMDVIDGQRRTRGEVGIGDFIDRQDGPTTTDAP
jgi:hypothetical protein